MENKEKLLLEIQYTKLKNYLENNLNSSLVNLSFLLEKDLISVKNAEEIIEKIDSIKSILNKK